LILEHLSILIVGTPDLTVLCDPLGQSTIASGLSCVSDCHAEENAMALSRIIVIDDFKDLLRKVCSILEQHQEVLVVGEARREQKPSRKPQKAPSEYPNCLPSGQWSFLWLRLCRYSRKLRLWLLVPKDRLQSPVFISNTAS